MYNSCIVKVQTVNLSIPKPLLKEVDRQAKAEARTRSGLVQEAVRAYLARKAAWESIFQYGRQGVKKLGIKSKDLEKIIDEYRAGR